MAVSPPKSESAAEPGEPGAPFPRDAIDPDLVRLARKRPQIGLITAAGVVAVCLYYLVHLGPDRRFAGEPEAPRRVAVADIAAGKVADDSYVSLDASLDASGEPMMSHAIRTAAAAGESGLRVAPLRGTGERVWLVMAGDDWQRPIGKPYAGRLRRIGDLPAARVLNAHLTRYPRPTFATAAAVRAGFATGKVQTVAGDHVQLADSDQIAFDVIDGGRALLIASFTGAREATADTPGHGELTDAKAWIAELARHEIAATPAAAGEVDGVLGQVRLDVAMSADAVTEKLEAAKLWAVRVERVTHHVDTTWAQLRDSAKAGFVVAGRSVPDAEMDLIGLFVQRGVPGDAYALIDGERPDDYWSVRPITIALAVISLLFAWALLRAVRDLLPTRAR